jgi:hypothetical protein
MLSKLYITKSHTSNCISSQLTHPLPFSLLPTTCPTQPTLIIPFSHHQYLCHKLLFVSPYLHFVDTVTHSNSPSSPSQPLKDNVYDLDDSFCVSEEGLGDLLGLL